MIFQTPMIMFHVNLPGCMNNSQHLKDESQHTQDEYVNSNVSDSLRLQ